MVFESQRDFNKYMDGYMDKLSKSRAVPKGSIFASKRRPERKPDKVIALEDKELQEVVEPKEDKKKRKSLLQKLMFFAGDIANQEKEAKKELSRDKGMTEEEFDRIFELDEGDMAPRKPAIPQRQMQPGQQPFYPRQQQAAQRPVGAISNGVPMSSLRQPADYGARRPETREVEQNFPYSPNAEKDIKYLVGLVNTILNRLEPNKRQEFYRSSEYRIFESVRKRY